MIRILITSHGGLAEGMLQSVRMLMGETENLDCVTFSEDMGMEELSEEFEKKITAVSAENQYLILCDIKGGTPFNVVSRFSYKNDNVAVIYGVNLPVLVEAIVRREGETLSKLVDVLEKEGPGTIGLSGI